eukprot:scaffold44_cov339-Pavlova_lutheri.AAC.20
MDGILVRRMLKKTAVRGAPKVRVAKACRTEKWCRVDPPRRTEEEGSNELEISGWLTPTWRRRFQGGSGPNPRVKRKVHRGRSSARHARKSHLFRIRSGRGRFHETEIDEDMVLGWAPKRDR